MRQGCLLAHHRPSYVLVLILCAGLVSESLTAAQIKAFPQAEGAGARATGGRGGDVYHVTSLGDDGSVGTLRHGITTATSAGRTIVFDVGGWITLNSKLGIDQNKSRITIAGQTAPGGGIGVRGDQFSVGGDDIIVRHMRFRPGKAAGRVDSVGVNVDAERVVFDHVSAGFSYDENFSTQATDLTVQYSTVSFGLEDHSAGSLIEQARRLTFHHNLYAHNHTRNPKARVNETIDWVNNVVYDYDNGFIAGDSDTTDYFWTANVDGNYFITGPGDTGRPMVRDGRAHNYGLYFGTNAFDNDGDTIHDGVLYTGNGLNGNGLEGVVAGAYTWSATPYPTAGVWQDATPEIAYQRVLQEFGATPWQRDEVDQRLYDHVTQRTGGLIERESDLVGISNGGFGTLSPGVAATDSDGDGMPDTWEMHYGTNPFLPSNNGDFDFDGYTDLEEYLNELAAFPAAGPLEFTGIGRYADWRHWTRQWEPTRFDEALVHDGAVFVDAVGQHAGTLKLGTQTQGNGRAYVTSGWIEISEDLVIGGQGSGRLDLYGGEVRMLGGDVKVVKGGLRIFGGRLLARSIDIGQEGELQFSGGDLSFDEIAGDLLNDGGTLHIGRDAVDTSIIYGDLTIQSGSLAVDVGSQQSV